MQNSVTELNPQYFELNNSKVLDVLDNMDVPTQVEVKKQLDENVTDKSKSDIIEKVFANKTKTLVSRKRQDSFDEGGAVNSEQEIWTPYQFLHDLLPLVYGKSYIMPDKEANKLYSEIEQEENDLESFIKNVLEEEGVSTIFQLKSVEKFEEVDRRRKAIEEKKVFISESELQAYVISNPDLVQENYVSKITVGIEELVEKGILLLNIDKEGSFAWTYRYQYLYGDVYAKLQDMTVRQSSYLEQLSQAQFDRQKDALSKAKKSMSRITYDGQNRIFIHPNSDFAKDTAEFQLKPSDFRFYEMSRESDIQTAFKGWMRDRNEVDASDFKVTDGARQVIKYYVEGDDPSKDFNDYRLAVNMKQNSQIDGEALFQKFLNDSLTDECKQRLELVWNAKYNSLSSPKYYKIPVALTLSRKFKDNVPFIPNPTQIQSVQYMRLTGSGLLAYGVGVGKTASSILNVSFAIDNGFANKPLFVVPNPTYEKWIAEMQGETVELNKVSYTNDSGKADVKVFKDKKDANKFLKSSKGTLTTETRYMKGLLPNLPKIVGLYNLNSNMVRYELKDYSDSEKKELELMDKLKEFISTLDKSYMFDNPMVNSKIETMYGDFEVENLLSDYRESVPRNSEGVASKSVLEFWKPEIDTYIRNLPYKLGTTKTFPDKTIYVTTYEGLAKLGIESVNPDEIDSVRNNSSTFGVLFKELTQGEEVNNFYRGLPSEGVMLEDAMFGGVGKQKMFAKDFGIDYAVFDESHFFKKVFVKSKGKRKKHSYAREDGRMSREKAKYVLGGSSGKPSTRAINGFALCRWIQMNNNNGNVVHLTATPFTNHPIEVYSMLALTNYQFLVDRGFREIEDFYDVFMKINFDIRFTPSQKIIKEQVLIGYNNAPQMRELIFYIMDYKNGEDANIKRPKKVMYPSLSEGRDTILPANALQEGTIKSVKQYVKGDLDLKDICDEFEEAGEVAELTDEKLVGIISSDGSDAEQTKWSMASIPLSESDRAKAESIVTKIFDKQSENAVSEDGADKKEMAVVRVLRGLTMLKKATLSPYLLSCKGSATKEPTAKEYVESSPKLMYTVNAIKTIHDFEDKNKLKRSGNVIYMNLGVNPSSWIKQDGEVVQKKWSDGGFEKIKKYLVDVMGYSDGEVSIVKGGMTPKNKEKEKNKFLSGESTILIGSATISTGVDLQNNASSLFVCSFDWNPTDNEQVSGRIHRQGNRFGNVRIVYPMIENSADPIIFQLLQEKTLRIKEIWDKEGKTSELDLRDFNPSDLKKKLITDPSDKTTYWLEENLKDLEDEKVMLLNRQKSLRYIMDDYDNLEGYRETVRAGITVIDAYRKNIKREEGLGELERKTSELTRELMSDPTKLVAELTKLGKNQYDHTKDPDGRYVLEDYSKLDDDELLKKATSLITNSDSWYQKLYNDDKSSLDEFARNNYGKYLEGDFLSDDERVKLTNKKDELNAIYANIEGDDERYEDIKGELKGINRKLSTNNPLSFSGWRNPIDESATYWKNAKKNFDKHVERLAIFNIQLENVDKAQQVFVDRIKEVEGEIEEVHSKSQEMFEVFTKEAEENRQVAPSLDKRVEEFAVLNPKLLTELLATFKEDEAVVVEDKPEQQEPVVVPEDNSEAQFLLDKINSFEMMLEMEDDADEKKFLEDKIATFELLLEMEEN
jgi:hypothetical protein